MTQTDKIFYSFMFVASAVIVALLLSLVGCTGPLQHKRGTITECDPMSVTITDRAMDPCELEYWEDQQFTARERAGG